LIKLLTKKNREKRNYSPGLEIICEELRQQWELRSSVARVRNVYFQSLLIVKVRCGIDEVEQYDRIFAYITIDWPKVLRGFICAYVSHSKQTEKPRQLLLVGTNKTSSICSEDKLSSAEHSSLVFLESL